MQKTSITYERCSDGLEKLSERFQNVLISNHNWYLSEIINSKCFYSDINQITDLPEKSFLKNYGNYAHAAVSIYDNEKRLIGVMCLSWVFSDIPVHHVSNDKFTDEFKKELFDDANSLKSYLL
jgi:hypothetical protein